MRVDVLTLMVISLKFIQIYGKFLLFLTLFPPTPNIHTPYYLGLESTGSKSKESYTRRTFLWNLLLRIRGKINEFRGFLFRKLTFNPIFSQFHPKCSMYHRLWCKKQNLHVINSSRWKIYQLEMEKYQNCRQFQVSWINCS